MKFQPKTEDDLKREQLCAPGKYPFTVLQAAEKQSKKLRTDGTPKEMIALKLNVHADDGADYHIYDYVSGDFMAHKLRHFAYSTGLDRHYETGTLTADACQEREGWCEIEIQEDKTGQYGPKNVVKDYVTGNAAVAPEPPPEKNTPAAQTSKPQPAPGPEEDDVPF